MAGPSLLGNSKRQTEAKAGEIVFNKGIIKDPILQRIPRNLESEWSGHWSLR